VLKEKNMSTRNWIAVSLTVFIVVILSIGVISYLSQQPPNQRDYFGAFSIVLTIPFIAGLVILVRHRNDKSFHPYLRNIGWIIFVLWILSLVFRSKIGLY